MNLLELLLQWRALPLADAITYLVLGSTVWLLACTAAARLLRRASAAARHMVWLLAFAGLFVGLLSLALPSIWRVPMLKTPAALVLFSPVSELGLPPRPVAPTPAPVYTARAPKPLLAPPEAVPASAPTRIAVPPAPAVPFSWTHYVAAAWIAGSLVALLPLLTGLLALHRLRLHASAVNSPEALALLSKLSDELAVRDVSLVASQAVAVPLTWGWRRPVLAVPEPLLSGDPAALCAVFLHELGHIRRRDFATQCFARATAAPFWFQPLAWMALRRLRLEREMACDDIVVERERQPARYAEALLALARELNDSTPVLRTAVAMAQRSHLEVRLRAILELSRVRAAASWRRWAPAFAALILLVAGLRLVRPASAQTQPSPAASTLSPAIQEQLRKLTERGPADKERLLTEYLEVELLTENKPEKTGVWVTAPEPSKIRCWIDRRDGFKSRVDQTPGVYPTDRATFSIREETAIHKDHKEYQYDHRRPSNPSVWDSEDREIFSAGDQFLLAFTDLHFQAGGLLAGRVSPDEELKAEMVDDPLGKLLFIERTFSFGTNQRTRYWLDPAHGLAIRRYEIAFAGKPAITNEVQELAEVKPGFWLPSRATQVGGTQRNHFTFTRREIELEIPASTFVFTPEEGPYHTKAPAVVTPAKERLTLALIDRESKRPLPGLKVRVTGEWRCGQPDPGFDLQSDAEGRVAVPLAKSTAFSLKLRTTGAGYVPTTVLWRSTDQKTPIALPSEYTLDLEKGTAIAGRVVDEQRQPIAGAKIELMISGGPSNWDTFAKLVSRRETFTTDAEGRWSCAGMPADLSTLLVRLQHPDFLSDNYVGDYRERAPLAGLRDGTSELVMKKGVILAGRVTDSDGRPVAGADVKQGRDRWGSSFPATKTGADGTYRFAHTEPGEVCLTVQANGQAPETQTFELEKSREDVHFVLKPAQTLRARLVDAAGRPVAGVRAYADTWRERNRALDFSAETDAEGRFTWTEAPAEPVLFDFVGGGVELRRVSLQAGPEEREVRTPEKK